MANKFDLLITDLDRLIETLPVAASGPRDLKIRCIKTFPTEGIDQLDWSIWQERESEQIWIHLRGGVAGIDVWYGPAAMAKK